METMFYHFSQVLGITILHSLWQGLIVYMLLRMYLQCFTSASAASRYKVAYGTLMVTSVWFLYTLVTEIGRYNWHPEVLPAQAVPLTLPNVVHQLTTPDSRYTFAFAGYMPYVTMLYLAGLVFNILKMLLAWNNIYKIRQNTTAAGFEQQVKQLSAKLNLRKKVTVAFSEWVDVPCITGFIKPVILMPFTIGNHLTADEVAAILLHEMAHIKRNDYLMNLIQQVMQILLFFNPFARLIGNVINQERENSCDDAVVQVTGSPLIYAQALLKLEENKQQQWHLALAATGKKYHLLNRIERIMKTKTSTLNIRPVLVALVLLTFSLSSLAWFNPKIENGRLSVTAVVKPLINEVFVDTIHKRKNLKVVKGKVQKFRSQAVGNKRVTFNGHDIQELNDPKLNALTAEVDKHAQAIEKHFSSEEFKKMEQELESKGNGLEALSHAPALKEWENKLRAKSDELSKLYENPEIRALEKEMEEYGKKIGKHYENADYRKLTERVSKLGVQLSGLQYGSKDYNAKLEELSKLSKQLGAYSNSPEIAKANQHMAELGKKMGEYYGNEHYKALQSSVKIYSDSLRKAFEGPEWKTQQEALRRTGKAMADYQKRPEIKRDMEALKQAQQRLNQYMATPEFKKKLQSRRLNSSIQNHIREEISEVRERAEKPEAPEKAEKAEKAEKVEPKEQ